METRALGDSLLSVSCRYHANQQIMTMKKLGLVMCALHLELVNDLSVHWQGVIGVWEVIAFLKWPILCKLSYMVRMYKNNWYCWQRRSEFLESATDAAPKKTPVASSSSPWPSCSPDQGQVHGTARLGGLSGSRYHGAIVQCREPPDDDEDDDGTPRLLCLGCLPGGGMLEGAAGVKKWRLSSPQPQARH